MLVSKQQFWLTSLAALFMLAAITTFAVFAFSATAAIVYGPLLLTAFVVALFLGLVCIVWLLRGLLRPYNQLVGEAKRAPVSHSGKTQNEAAFVLETFQSVVAQLQEQQRELERLSVRATKRADSAEQFSERIIGSMPTGLVAFDPSGHVTVMNGPAQALFGDRADPASEHFSALFSTLPTLADMVERDRRDSTRSDSPLKIARDAVVIDSTGLSIQEVFEQMMAAVRERQAAK